MGPDVRRSALSLICAHSHTHSTTAFLIREFEWRMNCCDKYASVSYRHARCGDSPKHGGFSRCVADRFSVYVLFFSFVEVHFFNSETSSLKLSTLTFFVLR